MTPLKFVSLSCSIYLMESENGVTLGDENCVIVGKYVEGSVPDLNIEGKNVDANTEVPTVNGISEPVSKGEGINSSGIAVEVAATVLPAKNSKTKKVLNTRIFVVFSCFSYEFS